MSDTTVVNVKHDEYDVYIGRANRWRKLKGSPFANPFKIGRDGSRGQVVAKYHKWILDQPELMERILELRGKRLGCWCAPDLCHGHVLAALADRGPFDTDEIVRMNVFARAIGEQS